MTLLAKGNTLMEFLHTCFGKENEGIQKVIFQYLTIDTLLPCIEEILLTKEVWEQLHKLTLINPVNGCQLLTLIKEKNIEIWRSQNNGLSSSYILNSGEKEDRNQRFREIDLVYLNCLKSLIQQMQNVFTNLKSLEVKLEIFEEAPSSVRNQEMVQKLAPYKCQRKLPFDVRSNALRKKIKNETRELNRLRHKFCIILSSASFAAIDTEIDLLFSSILKLVYEEGILDLHMVYLSFFNSSNEMLLEFCKKEDVFVSQSDLSVTIFNEELFKNSLNVKNLFLCTANLRNYLLSYIYKCISNGFSKELILDFPYQLTWGLPFYLLIFLHQWSLSKDKLSLLPFFQSLMQTHGNTSDPLIRSICAKKISHMELTQWCKNYYLPLNAHKLLTLLQTHSTLYAIQATIPLIHLPYQKLLEILSNENEGDEVTNLKAASTATYKGYFAMLLSFHIISAGIEVDKAIAAWQEKKNINQNLKSTIKAPLNCNFEVDDGDLSNCKLYYKEHIAKIWFKVKDILEDLFPLEYRLEILENIFSLLFIQHTYFCDEGNEDSFMDEGEQTSPTSLKHDVDEFMSNSSPVSSSSVNYSVSSIKMLRTALKGGSLSNCKVLSVNEMDLSEVERDPHHTFMEESSKFNDEKKCSSGKYLSKPLKLNSVSLHETHEHSSSSPSLKLFASCTNSDCSSSSVGDFPWCGYIINTLVAWDLLLLLRESINAMHSPYADLNAHLYSQCGILSSISKEEFQDRLSCLKQKVNDALWRVKIVIPQQRELGSDSEIESFMRGTLISNASSFIQYEKENEIQDEKSSKSHPKKLKKKGKLILRSHSTINAKEKDSITKFLLASPQELLSIALINGNLGGAQDVVQTHHLLNSKEKQELVLMQCLSENIPKVEEISKLKSREIVRKVNIESSAESAAKKIENEIHLNSHNVAISTLIDQTLNLSMLENPYDDFMECEEIPWVQICPKLVLLDIALTSSISEENALKLFTVAFNQDDNSLFEGLVKKPFLLCLFNCLEKPHQLMELREIMEIIKHQPKKSILKEGNINALQILLPKIANPASLLLSTCPLNKIQFQSFLSSWSKLLSCLSKFDNEFSPFKSAKIKDKGSQDIGSSLHLTYKNLITTIKESHQDIGNQCNSSNLSKQTYKEHLVVFSNYLKLLESINNKQFFVASSNSSTCCFELLSQKPIDIIGDLIFVKQINPYELEVASLNMHLDIMSVIVKYVCPLIPLEPKLCSDRKKEPSKSSSSLESFGCHFIDGHFIMNANKLSCSKPAHGDLIVTDLLSSLLDNLCEISYESKCLNGNHSFTHEFGPTALKNAHIRALLLETSELGSTDLRKLNKGKEMLTFFINLANLMFIHASLINFLIVQSNGNNKGIFSRSKLEQVITFKHVGYVVGQLGFLSLFEVLYVILKQPLCSEKLSEVEYSFLPFIDEDLGKEKYAEAIEKLEEIPPSLIFVVNQGLQPSPKINIFYPDTFVEELEASIMSYINHVIVTQLNGNCKSYVVNIVLYFFLSSHPGGWEEAIGYLRNIVLEDDFLIAYFEWLKRVNKKKQDLRINFVLDRENSVIIDYKTDLSNELKLNAEEEDLTFENNDNEAMKEGLSLSPSILSFINDKCPIIRVLIESLYQLPNTGKLTVLTNDINEDLYLSQGNKLLDVSFIYNLFTLFNKEVVPNNLCGSKQILQCLQFGSSYFPVMSSVKELLTTLAKSDYMQKNDKSVTVFLKVKELLSSLPSTMYYKNFELVYIWDYTMAYLSGVHPSKVMPHPWLCSYKIKNPSLRFKVVEDNFIDWPVDIALRFLWFLEADGGLDSPQKSRVKENILQMEIYDEILKLPRGELNLTTSKDVLKASSSIPESVLEHLIEQRQFALAVRWVQCHNLTEKFYYQTIQNSLLECLDVMDPDFKKGLTILSSIPLSNLDRIVATLLQRLNVHCTRKFLIGNFIQIISQAKQGNSENLYTSTSPMLDICSLKQELMGLLLVEDISPRNFNRWQLFSLLTRPNLILEQWIMNLKFDAVEKASNILAPFLNDIVCRSNEASSNSMECLCWSHYYDMIEKYAFKALEMSGIQISFKQNLKEENFNQQFVVPLKVPAKQEWQKNSTSSTCPVCKTAVFSLFCRRHHCRRCGRVVCVSCSKNRLIVDGYGQVPVRVCQDCVVNMRTKPTPEDLSTSSHYSSTRNSIADANESASETEDKSSIYSDIGWFFSIEDYHNQCVREEFSFDCAPSLSLCQAILALHKDDKRAALCILKLSHKLLLTAVDSFKADFSEVDSNFVLQMIQTLMSSAKIRFGNLWNHNGISVCEYYNQWVDILQLLFNSRCISLLPHGTLGNMLNIGELQQRHLADLEVDVSKIQEKLQQERKFLRVLRDCLVKNEMWHLALNISTKAGFETSGIWGALAMASLKAGDFVGARDYFAKVLMKPRDKNISIKSLLLSEIISYLESQPVSCNTVTRSRRGSSTSLENVSKESSSNPIIVFQALKNLTFIANGGLTVDDACNQKSPVRSAIFVMDPLLQRECEYYLRLYGCHRTFLQFLLRHKRIRDAAKYALEMDIEASLFAEEVILPCFKHGLFPRLWKEIQEIDPKQKWSPSIMFSCCKYLERKKYFHCLLEIQKALSDKLRAAMTLIRLYTQFANNYTELLHRTPYLTEAVTYLQEYLDVIPLGKNSFSKTTRSSKYSQSLGLSGIILHSSSWNVNQQINLASFQDDGTKYLAEIETQRSLKLLIETIRQVTNENKESDKSLFTLHDTKKESNLVPTVFAPKDRIDFAVAIICAGKNVAKGVSLVYRLVEIDSIDPKELLRFTLQTLIKSRRTEELSSVVEGILDWGLIPKSRIRDLLWPTISWVGQNASEKITKDIVKHLVHPTDKMDAFMEMGLLKLAYFQIVGKGSKEDIAKLHKAAAEKKDRTVVFYCTKWFENYNSEIKRKS